ncbi:MAG: hypothetical protein KGL39_03865 [Patescibacteria group bacterium]|nr:hypothetical protein [Patescibacteria group bacterium]
MLPKVWKPGQSGNPGGKGGTYKVALSLARKAGPDAVKALIGLLNHPDGRVVAVAANSILDRAYGKPKEKPDTEQDDSADLSSLPVVILSQIAQLASALETHNAASQEPQGDAESQAEHTKE